MNKQFLKLIEYIMKRMHGKSLRKRFLTLPASLLFLSCGAGIDRPGYHSRVYGDSCAVYYDCEAALVCFESRCAAQPETLLHGQTCLFDQECASGLSCQKDRCKYPEGSRKALESCVDSDECQTGLLCAKDNRCQALPRFNEACEPDLGCRPPFSCNDNLCGWPAKQVYLSSTQGWDNGMEIAADQKGNLYVGGVSTTTPQGAPAGGVFDGFVTKINQSAEVQWSQGWNTSKSEAALTVDVGEDQAVYVGGMQGFSAACDLLPWREGEAVLRKYLPNGEADWELEGKALVPAGTDGTRADVHAQINDLMIVKDVLFVLGAVQAAPAVEDKRPAVRDFFVLKLDAKDGSTLAARRYGDPSEDEFAFHFTRDAQNNLWVTGTSSISAKDSTDQTNSDGFVAKLSSDLEVQWTYRFGGAGFDIVYDITVDSKGAAYAVGATDGKLSNELGKKGVCFRADNEAIVLKLDAQGNEQWRQILHPSTGTNEELFTVVLMSDQQTIFVGGNTTAALAETLAAPSGKDDIFWQFLSTADGKIQGTEGRWGSSQMDVVNDAVLLDDAVFLMGLAGATYNMSVGDTMVLKVSR